MKRQLAASAGTLMVMVGLDLLWLGVIAKPIYQQGIGHLMADKPNVPAAVLFYALFGLWAGGVCGAARQPPPAGARPWAWRHCSAFSTYATYDLTNLATLKQWPIGLSQIDMAWGSCVSAVAAASSKALMDWAAPV